jgi:DUF4097 and DUF4098 domain-containing protein YvlB
MKKRTMIALIVAAALIITGGIILVLGLFFAGGSKGASKLVRQEITIQESFDNIAIDTADCDVKFAMFSGRDDCMVEVRSYKNVKHTATVEDGTLKIKMIDKRNWTDHINIGWTESMEMTVYLPAAEYESMQVRTTTGDIAVGELPVFREMELRSTTGDISCAGVSGDVLDCMTTTGDISVQNSVADVLKLQSNTGDFAVSVVAGNEIHMRTNTGEVNAENVNALMFTCQTESGDVELEGVLAEDYLQLFADTGDIHITNSDAATVNIETNSGDVSGNFLTPKWFSAFSDTGDVTVPNTPEGGECSIQTDSGDIHFE